MKQPGEDQISHFLLSTVRHITWTDRGDQNELPRNEPTHDIDTQECQTIGDQYPYITSYANDVMYFSWSTGNYQLYAVLRAFNPNNHFNN